MNIIKEEKKYMLGVFKRYPICFTKGKGQYLYDNKGKKYLDFFSGVAVTSFGHSHPKITKAILKQSQILVHTSNHFYTMPQIELAKLLTRHFPKSKVFFSNSGAEANECAIKLARKWGTSQHPHKFEIISFSDSFHGRTMATLSATAQPKLHEGFSPLLPGFRYIGFNDVRTLEKTVSKKTCAIIVEPILGEGGVHIANQAFMKTIAKQCKKHNILLICDEIQTGLGRTGKMFGFKHYGLKPDIISLAKALGAGLPIGATLISDKIAHVFSYGAHGSTFGGNPVACAAGAALVKLLIPSKLKHIRETGEYLLHEVEKLSKKYKWIKEVRGKGLMCAIETTLTPENTRNIVEMCLKKGLIINVTQGNILRFLPPYIITKKDIQKMLNILAPILKQGELL